MGSQQARSDDVPFSPSAPDSSTISRQSVESSPRLYKALAEAMPALVLTTSADGDVVYCNDELLDYCGVQMGDLQGSRWVDLIHPEDVAAGSERWMAEIQTLKPFSSEYRIRRHDGVYRWYLTRTAPLRNADDEIEGWVGVSVDVHDRRVAEDDMRQMSEELRRANAAKDEFLAMVSHELRTPVTTIYGNASVLQRQIRELPREQIVAVMTDVEREALRLQQLIDNMFVLARIEEHGKADIEPISLGRVVDKAATEHRNRYPETQIRVHDSSAGVPACGDETYVLHILRNLVINAEKYSPSGAPIDIHMARHDETTLSVRVCDAGVGIKGEVDRIFETFYRSPETADYAPGAGMGLAVARRLVETQGGIIWARNREGGGAEVGFTLPIEEDAA